MFYPFERCFDSRPMAVKSVVVAEAVPFYITSLYSNWSWD